MAKNRPTPLKDEPTNTFDDLCRKIDELITIIKRQNGYLQQIAKQNGLDSEYNSTINEMNISKMVSDAVLKFLRERNAKVNLDGKEDATLTKTKEVLEEYRTALQKAKDANNSGNSGEVPPTTVVIHEAVHSTCIERPQQPQSAKGMFAYLFYRLPWYHVRCFFASSYFRRWLIIIMICMWFLSICLTCIMAIDNARMHQVYRAVFMHAGT